MIDNSYRNAFKEVFDILNNTDEELVAKIPNKFMQFLKTNMNTEYETNIAPDLSIDNQNILKETESILALIYRSYWATEEEKLEFATKDKKELINEEKIKKEFQDKDITEIFEQRKNIDKISLDNHLMVIKKENFIKKIFNKLLIFFKK